jgi:hypothetical protein
MARLVGAEFPDHSTIIEPGNALSPAPDPMGAAECDSHSDRTTQLKELVKRGQKIKISVCDITRPAKEASCSRRYFRKWKRVSLMRRPLSPLAHTAATGPYKEIVRDPGVCNRKPRKISHDAMRHRSFMSATLLTARIL